MKYVVVMLLLITSYCLGSTLEEVKKKVLDDSNDSVVVIAMNTNWMIFLDYASGRSDVISDPSNIVWILNITDGTGFVIDETTRSGASLYEVSECVVEMNENGLFVDGKIELYAGNRCLFNIDDDYDFLTYILPGGVMTREYYDIDYATGTVYDLKKEGMI